VQLSCQYCYEFGGDSALTQVSREFMDLETAQASVDFLLDQSAGRRAVHITFFGGETLMNFPLLKSVVCYATERAEAQGRSIDFSLTTNATLLTPAIIEFLSEHRIGVTVSMDGPKAMHDQLRVFANGKGSYDIIEPRVRALIQNHRTRPITCRVTLTSGVTDVVAIYARSTTWDSMRLDSRPFVSNRLYSINERGMPACCRTIHVLADEWLNSHCAAKCVRFTNVSDTLAELVRESTSLIPAARAWGWLASDRPGDVRPAIRFVDSDTHALGQVSTGIDRPAGRLP
jgi:uncharacterized protein